MNSHDFARIFLGSFIALYVLGLFSAMAYDLWKSSERREQEDLRRHVNSLEEK
jgi:hypothetical protein